MKKIVIFYTSVLNNTPDSRYSLPAVVYIGRAGTDYDLLGGSE